MFDPGDGVAHTRIFQVFDSGDEIPDLSGVEGLSGEPFQLQGADFFGLVGLVGGEEMDRHPLPQGSLKHPDVGHGTPILIEDGVEDEGFQGRLAVAPGGRDLFDDGPEKVADADVLFGADFENFRLFNAQQVVDLHDDPVDLRIGQVDFVDNGNDREVVLQGEEDVADGLRLYPLAGVDQQDRPLAGGEGSGDFVGEIDVPRGVDEVEDIGLVIGRPVGHADGVGFDGNPPFALQVHAVQDLRFHLLLRKGEGAFQEPVCQGRFPVVDVGDDGEVTNLLCIHSRV